MVSLLLLPFVGAGAVYEEWSNLLKNVLQPHRHPRTSKNPSLLTSVGIIIEGLRIRFSTLRYRYLSNQ
jgi:hypothetical protein